MPLATKIAAELATQQSELDRLRDTHKREEQRVMDRIQRLRKAEASLKDPKAQQAIDLLVDLGWLQE